LRSEFRYNRRYGRRTVAKWSRGGYRSRRTASSSTRSYTRAGGYSSPRPKSSSVSPVPAAIDYEVRPVSSARNEFSPLVGILALLVALFLGLLISLF